jgi:hypothetical protein
VPLAALALASSPIAPTALVVAATLASVWYDRPWRPADPSRRHFVDAAVRLTAPGDYVFDLKGEAVFRRRPVYYIYDAVGRALTGNGTLPDRAPEQMVARGCCAATADWSHIPPRTRAFLNAHFVAVGPLRVCGSVVRDGSFIIAVPQTYAVVSRDRVVIDGTPYRGPRFLAAGAHTLTSSGQEPVTVIWWRADVAPPSAPAALALKAGL